MQLYLPVTVTRAEQTSEFAKALAEELAREKPERVTAVMAKARRRVTATLEESASSEPVSLEMRQYVRLLRLVSQLY